MQMAWKSLVEMETCKERIQEATFDIPNLENTTIEGHSFNQNDIFLCDKIRKLVLDMSCTVSGNQVSMPKHNNTLGSEKSDVTTSTGSKWT